MQLQNPDLAFEYFLCTELHMTHARLLHDLGIGEIAHWRAYFETKHEQYEKSRREAEKLASKQ